MEDNLLLRIKKKLRNIGEDYDPLRPFMKERLFKVEAFIFSKEEECKRGKELINNSTFSVKSIAEELGCSRTTLYNHNQLLKRFIEESMDKYEAENLSKNVESLKDEIRQLKRQVKLMEIRDIEIERQKMESKQLKEKLNSVKRDNEKLLNRIVILNNENQKLKYAKK